MEETAHVVGELYSSLSEALSTLLARSQQPEAQALTAATAGEQLLVEVEAVEVEVEVEQSVYSTWDLSRLIRPRLRLQEEAEALEGRGQ